MCHPAEWRCQLNLSRTAGRDGTHRKHHKGGPRCCIPAPHFTCLWQSTWHAGEHGVSFQIFYPPHLFSSGKRVHVHDLWLQWTFYSGFFCELWFNVISSFNRHFIYILFYNHNCNNYLKITVYLNGSWVSLPIPSYSDLSIHGLLFWFISQLLEHGACLIVIFFFSPGMCVGAAKATHTMYPCTTEMNFHYHQMWTKTWLSMKSLSHKPFSLKAQWHRCCRQAWAQPRFFSVI